MKKAYGRGWEPLVRALRTDLQRIAPGLHIVEISEGRLGRLQVYYSDRDLTSQQMAALDRRVQKAEETAWQVCVTCGEFGRPAYIYEPPTEANMRVFCEEHKPLDWNFLD